MFDFNINEHKYNHIHFIGIGGISMSGIAKIMLKEGYKVSGSDSKKSALLDDLSKNGAKIYISHSIDNIEDADLVVYTDAVNLDNIEIKEAIKRKIDLIDRASFLGALMKNYEVSIAVSGTHGKTSTTSMLTEIVYNLDKNPTILLGGQLDNINGNVRLGDNKLFLTEACEYKANILKYYPTTAIILNIDEDHLDYFDNIDHIIDTFKKYASNLTSEDKLILNVDNENTKELLNCSKAKLITVSIENKADYMAKNISFSELGFPKYDLYHKEKFIGEVELSILGYHNIYNSLCAIAGAVENNIPYDLAIKGIKSYKGVHRRLEYKGEFNGAIIQDDYAHHPTEIKAALEALRKSTNNNLYCIFQPHTFTRTKLLLDSFSKSFFNADKIIITDIYAAREKDYGDIHSRTLCKAIRENGSDALFIETFEEIVAYLKKEIKTGDTVVTMGAGDVYKIADILLENKS
ncbi:MAG: UDP-N-acetylmuramate--L-alanine ligase [Peptoniphilaceae bacterium]